MLAARGEKLPAILEAVEWSSQGGAMKYIDASASDSAKLLRTRIEESDEES